VTVKPFGRYRETGSVGWLGNMNGTDPCWFAYRVVLPEAQQLYRFEVEYPDDARRTFCFAVKSGTTAYPIAVGADAGGEFALTHGWQTLSLFYWARTTDVRAVLITPVTGSRAAAGRIRVYAVETPLPPPVPASPGGRRFANWYEEGASLFGLYGAPDFKRYNDWTVADAELSADRFCELLAHMGGDTFFFTHAIYQFGLYPSRYNTDHNGPDSPDVVGLLIAACSRHGLGFVGEFHPEARELARPADPADPHDPHYAISLHGLRRAASTQPAWNPLHPDNQQWYLGMLGEFADRYAHHAALLGVSLRLMEHTNPGLNNFQSLEWGYDDWTVAAFAADTGQAVPGDAGDPGRFLARYRFLTGPARERWVSWRCDRITDLHGRIVARVRQARPDLRVYVHNHFEPATLREAGIDPALLSAAGVQLVATGCYGRHPAVDHRRMRDRLMDPAQLRALAAPGAQHAFLVGNYYFEASEPVLPPTALGYPADTPTGWISAVIAPSGRHFLERYAVALAESDALLLGDGGNTYTLGQPLLREFLREYRRLPDVPFTPRADARDPVAVWEKERVQCSVFGVQGECSVFSVQGSVFGVQSGNAKAHPNTGNPTPETQNLNTEHRALNTEHCFYAVNREPFAVPVCIRLTGAARVRDMAAECEIAAPDGTLAFELEGYGLRVFAAPAGTRIASVETAVPRAAREMARRRAAWIAVLAQDARAGRLDAALGPGDLARLEDAAREADACARESRTWRLRTLLASAPLQRICAAINRFPPALSDDDPPEAPAGAFGAEAIAAAAKPVLTVVPAADADPNWAHTTLAISAAAAADSIVFDVPVGAAGRYQVCVGHAAGGGFGPADVTIDGSAAGDLPGGGDTPAGVLTVLPERPALRPPAARVAVRPRAGGRIGLAFVHVRPVMRTLAAGDWLAAGPYLYATAGGERLDGETIMQAMRNRVYPAETARDLDAEVPLDGGARGAWVVPAGVDGYVDFRRTFQRMAGSLAYAVTHLRVAADCDARLVYGADYFIRLWVNGTLIADVPSQGGAAIRDRFEQHVPLRAGWNELRVKLASGTYGNGFWMAVSDPGDLRVDARGRSR
jgi:hypothetical protein